MSSTNATDATSTSSARSRAAYRLFLKRQDSECQAAVRRIEIRVLAAQARGQDVELGSRLFDRRAGLQRGNDVVVLAVADLGRVCGHRERQDDFRIFDYAERRHDLAWQGERRRQNADDSCGWPLSVSDRPMTPRSPPYRRIQVP